jgi:hypothetical protein
MGLLPLLPLPCLLSLSQVCSTADDVALLQPLVLSYLSRA